MHSFLGFLLTTDFSPSQIETEIINMKNELEFSFKKSLEAYEKKEWCTPFKCRINKEFQDKIWSSRHDLFTQLEAELKGFDVNKPEAEAELRKKLRKVQEEF